MNIVPLFDRVVLQAVSQPKSAALFIPKEMEEKPDLAKVIAVGDGLGGDHPAAMQVTVGDLVLYSKYAASEFVLDGETFILIKQTDILAKVQ